MGISPARGFMPAIQRLGTPPARTQESPCFLERSRESAVALDLTRESPCSSLYALGFPSSCTQTPVYDQGFSSTQQNTAALRSSLLVVLAVVANKR